MFNLPPGRNSECEWGNVPSNRNILIGYNENANVRTNTGAGHIHKETFGSYGIENRNKKGTTLLHLLTSLEMIIANSFVQKRASSSSPTTTHMTWKKPSTSK